MKNQKKILMIGPDAQGGITSVINLYLENGLSDSVIFLPSYIGGAIFSKLVCFFIFWLKYLYILFFNRNIKLIHAHSSAKGSFLRKFFVVIISKLFNKKVVFHLHSPDFHVFYNSTPNLIKKIITYTLNKADVIIALSPQCKRDIAETCSNNNIIILYNPAKFKNIDCKINHQDSEKINVLFMGIIGKRKGAYDVVEAAQYLTNPNIRITLYGDGEVAELRNEVINSNVSDKVIIEGWISGKDIEVAYKNADIYILPSYNEGLPMSILEAMTYCLPIISTPVGGIPEAVHDGVNGYLINPGDCKALAEKIELLATDKPLREQMGLASYKLVQEKFDINVIIKQLKEIYQDVLK